MGMYKKIYFFGDLSENAKEKARGWWRDNDDMPFLGSHLTNIIKEKLEEKGFKVLGNTAEDDLKIFFSLSYCQGDGVSFEVTLSRNGITYEVNQSGRYVHELALDVIAERTSDGHELEVSEETMQELRDACKETERVGYDEIEYESSPEYIDEIMEANEYTFTAEGVRMDADK